MYLIQIEYTHTSSTITTNDLSIISALEYYPAVKNYSVTLPCGRVNQEECGYDSCEKWKPRPE